VKNHPRKYFLIGILLSLFGAICFSTKAIFVKLAYLQTEVDAVSLLALRMIFSLPFFLISAFTTSYKATKRFSPTQWAMVVLIGCLGYYISSLLDFLGLQYVSAGIERLILFIYPTLVLLISSVIFSQRVLRWQWIAVIISYMGLLIAFYGEVDVMNGANGNFVLGSIMIFTCAITYAAYIVGSGRLIPIVGAAKFNSYAMTFACFGVLLHFGLNATNSLTNFSTGVYSYSVLMAIFSTVIPSYLISEGIKRIGSDNAAIVGGVGPVSTIVQAHYFLGEPFSALQILGTALVMIGVLIISRKSMK
jgi:drug/metabolite transporter (DMT)-like permease